MSINKNGITCWGGNSYTNETVKKEIEILMNIIKKYNNQNKRAYIFHLKGLKVPEIENSGINIGYCY